MKWKIVALLAALLALPAMAVEYKTIDWDVLIPAGEKLLPPPGEPRRQPCLGAAAGGRGQPEAGQPRGAHPGLRSTAGGDAKKITAFLLVPYFGACIHVPPRPPIRWST